MRTGKKPKIRLAASEKRVVTRPRSKHVTMGTCCLFVPGAVEAFAKAWLQKSEIKKNLVSPEGVRLPYRRISPGADDAVTREWINTDANIGIMSKEGVTILKTKDEKEEYFKSNLRAKDLLKFAVLTNLSMVASVEAKGASDNVEAQLRVQMMNPKTIPRTAYESQCFTGGNEVSLVLDLESDKLTVVTESNITAMVRNPHNSTAAIPGRYGSGSPVEVARVRNSYEITVDPEALAKAKVRPFIQIKPVVSSEGDGMDVGVKKVIVAGLLDTAVDVLSLSSKPKRVSGALFETAAAAAAASSFNR